MGDERVLNTEFFCQSFKNHGTGSPGISLPGSVS